MPAIKQDYSSPRAALRTLEDAYTAKDLEAAMAARDFRYEAEDVLAALARANGVKQQPGDELSIELEGILRLRFRQHALEQGAYDCTIVEEIPVNQHLLRLVEECVRKADGHRTRQVLHAFNRANEWKIVELVIDERT
jgi:hypothetical protein